MKLSVENYVFRTRFGEFEGFEYIKKAGFEFFDMSFYSYSSKKPNPLDEGYENYYSSLRAHVDSLGLKCNQAHAPFELRYGAEFTEDEPLYKRLVHSIHAAAMLGAEQIIVHAINVPEGVDLVEYNRGYYLTLKKYAEKYGIKIAVENLFSHDAEGNFTPVLGNPQILSDMVLSLGLDSFCACIDIGHAALNGFAPQDFIRGMKPEALGALHIQDGDGKGDRHVMPYIGDFKWSEIIAALKEIGYKGDLTFEIISYLRRFPDELILDALSLAKKVGDHMISRFERD